MCAAEAYQSHRHVPLASNCLSNENQVVHPYIGRGVEPVSNSVCIEKAESLFLCMCKGGLLAVEEESIGGQSLVIVVEAQDTRILTHKTL